MHNIRYLRVMVTTKCNLNCFFCHREGIKDREWERRLDLHHFMDCIEILIRCGIMKIKFIGGEPTLFTGLGKMIHNIKIINPKIDVSIITNGICSKKTLNKLVDLNIDRINVSLHGFNESNFKRLTGGTIQQLDLVFDTIQHLSQKKVLGKLNYVLLKGTNEREFLDVLDYVRTNGFILDVLNYLDDDFMRINQFYYSFPEIESMIGKYYVVEKREMYINKYSIPSVRLYLEGGGIINLKVNELKEVHFLQGCESCPKKDYCREGIAAIRLTAAGIIRPCLFRDDNCFDYFSYISDHTNEETMQKIREYLSAL